MVFFFPFGKRKLGRADSRYFSPRWILLLCLKDPFRVLLRGVQQWCFLKYPYDEIEKISPHTDREPISEKLNWNNPATCLPGTL